MNTSLLGKRVLITGAATGIGRAAALEFATLGAHVAVNYYPTEDQYEKAEEVIHGICIEVQGKGCRSLVISADVSKERDVEKMFVTLEEEWGGIDILINNAGVQRKCPSHELTVADFNRVFMTDALGAFLCAREAIKSFLGGGRKGVIINNTSVHQLIPKPQYLSYSMSKGALLNMARTLALEYAHAGIRVNNVAPGAIATPINPWSTDKAEREEIGKHIPLGKVGEAEQIAKAITFLASDEASYVTGQTLFIDGGLTLYPDFYQDWASS